MKKYIITLIKFGERKYMEDFKNEGKMFFQRLRKYCHMENREQGDTNEGLTHVYQPDKITLTVNGIEVSEIQGVVKVDETGRNPLIHCMYTLNSDHYIDYQKSIDLIDKKCCDFGDTALVITNLKEFHSRFKDACEQRSFGAKCKTVKYVDPESYHGEMGAFRKFDNFSHQNEFRFLLDASIQEESYTLELGSIEDISMMVPVGELNGMIKFKNR
ncbi:MAG: hypothetical protein OCC49_10385 [Fibrobacterales bacterium]